MKKTVISILVSLIAISCLFAQGIACSLIMKTNSQGTFVGRTTDFYSPLNSRVAIYPRHFSYNDDITGTNWTSKYGAIIIEETSIQTASQRNSNAVATEGINEKGLTAHSLALFETKIPPFIADKPAVNAMLWVKYVLATNATVNEVVQNLGKYQIVQPGFSQQGHKVSLSGHFAVNDASGDAALIEFIDGKMQVYHGPQYTVMTNDPNLLAQQANLNQTIQANKQHSVADLPGGADSKNRFVRASFFMESMPQPVSLAQGVAYMEEAINGISVQAFDDKKHPNPADNDAWETRWRVVYDLKNMNMYFNQDDSGKKVYIKVRDIDFTSKAIKYIELLEVKSDYDI